VNWVQTAVRQVGFYLLTEEEENSECEEKLGAVRKDPRRVTAGEHAVKVKNLSKQGSYVMGGKLLKASEARSQFPGNSLKKL